MRVLITGLDGFTGRYVRKVLEARGDEVWGLSAGKHDNPQYSHIDIGDPVSLADFINEVRPQAVIHLAAISFVGHGDAEAFYRVNVVGTRNLLSVLASANVDLKAVILASSANVYGNQQSNGGLNEHKPVFPTNDYAVSKLAMEHMAKLWSDQLPIIITRPFNYTGRGQAASFLIPKIVDHFKRRAHQIELGNLDVWRDFCDVRDVAQAYVGLLAAGKVGETYNICSGRLTSLREAIRLMENLTGHHMRVEMNHMLARAKEVEKLCGDATKLKRALPEWSSRSFEETLKWMLFDD